MERARLNVADGADERRRGLENTGMAQDFLVQQFNGFKENNRIFMIFVCWMLDPPRFFDIFCTLRTLLQCFPPQSVAVAPWPKVKCSSSSDGKGGTAVLRGFRPNEEARCADTWT